MNTRDAYLMFLGGTSFDDVARDFDTTSEEMQNRIREYAKRLQQTPRVHHEIQWCGRFPQRWTDREEFTTCRLCLAKLDRAAGRK